MSDPLWTAVTIGPDFLQDAPQWTAAHMSEGMPWLLVHADDGVIWGCRQADGSLTMSGQLFSDKVRYPALTVELRATTVQQLRIFGPEGEIFFWRTDGGFQGRSIVDGPNALDGSWQEQHILWGTHKEEKQGFTVLEEGQQGQIHAVPLPVPQGERAVLTVRHYLQSGTDGRAYVAMNRLVDVGFQTTRKGQ